MPKIAPCRIDGIVAKDANRAVLFRRGPSRHCQMLIWDFARDEVIPGQWLKAKVHTPRCDVSPDGRYLVYMAADYGSRRAELSQFKVEPYMGSSWTAISRPPYFTAIGLWFMGASYNGGGIWEDDRTLLLNSNPHWEQALKPAKQIKVRPLRIPSGDDEIFSQRLIRRGWIERQTRTTTVSNPKLLKAALAAYRSQNWIEPLIPKVVTSQTGILEKPFENGFLRRESAHNWERWSIHEESGEEVRFWKPKSGHPHWLDLDAQGRIVFAENGCLYHWATFPKGEPVLVADLNPNVFEPIPPPEWALEW